MLLVAIISLPFLYVLVRKPVLRRLAVRNAVRRPREALLVVAGSLLGTAIITGSLVTGDTFDASLRAQAYDQLGPIDQVVSAAGLDARADLDAAFAGFEHPDVDGVLAMTTAGAATATVDEPRRAEPSAQLMEVDFAAAREFGGDPGATGIDGETPGGGDAVVGDELAGTLDVEVGDRVDVFAYGVRTTLTVTDVLPKRGVAGFVFERSFESNNLFVAPGTIAALYGQATTPGAPPQSLVLVSNRGGVEAGADHTDTVVPVLRDTVAGSAANVDGIKRTVLDDAQEAGDQLGQFYTSMGTFAVLAGILLLVNIFFMLADERKSEFGMLRAVGLRRSALVGAFATEGWLYAVVSAVAGSFVGLGLGRVIMAAANRIFSSGPDEFSFSLRWHFEWTSVATGLTAGFVIAVVTILVTSVWLSRFNIIQAIRDITEPRRRRPRKRALYAGFVLAAVGLALTAAGFGSASFAPIILGPVFVLTGVGPALARNLRREPVISALAALVLGWAVVAVPIGVALDADIEVTMFVIQGLVLVFAAVVLVSQHQAAIGHAIGRLANRSLRVRLGLAYPLARKFRTAMTLGMFALVMFIITYVSVISAMFRSQTDTFAADLSGGFNVVAESNAANPVDFEALTAADGARQVAPLISTRAEISVPDVIEPTQWRMTAFDQSLVDGGVPVLDDRGAYSSDVDAFQAVLDDPSLAIVDEFFLSTGAGPPAAALEIGDRFVMRDPLSGTDRTMTVAAKGPQDWVFNGGLIGVGAAREVFGEGAVANRAYIDAEDPAAFADAFAGRFLENGGEAETIADVVDEGLSQQQQFFLLMRGFLALGLIIGIAGIGVIMVRAVRERRRQVGVLRALGFQAAAVRSAFVVESAFVAVEGVLVGVGLALVTSFSITLTDSFGDSMRWTVPIGELTILVVGTLLVALAATAGPARAAAKIRPAVALRIAD